MNHEYKNGDVVKSVISPQEMTVLNCEPDMLYVTWNDAMTHEPRFTRLHHQSVILVRRPKTEITQPEPYSGKAKKK